MIPFINAILEPALWWAADWSLRWAVLLALVALMLWIFRPRRAALRQLFLLVALAAGLILPFAPRWGGGWERTPKASAPPAQTKPLREFPGERGRVSAPSGERGRISAPSGERGRVSAPSERILGALTQPRSPSEPLGHRRLIILGIASCWSFAVAWQLMRCFCGWIFLRRLKREAVDATGSTADLFASCRAELQVWSAVRLAAHPRVRSPILLGLWRPMIVVPPDWPERSIETQRAGLLHELSHIRRRDHWLVPLLETVRIAFFFHPFVRWLLARLEHERELLCDEMVVGRGIDPRDYARLLVELARSSGRLAWPTVSLPMGRRRTVKGRIHHLLEEDMERWIGPLPLRWAVVLGSGLLALMLGLASYQVLAVEKQEPVAAADAEKAKPVAEKKEDKKSPAGKPAGDAIKREDLRYGGKDFYQWRRELLTELKPSIRADGLVALGTFGANGFGTEATQAILDMMRGYDPGIENDKEEFDSSVVAAGYKAIHKIGGAAVPALAEAVKDKNRNVRCFAIEALRRMPWGDVPPALPALIQAFKNDDRNTRSSAIVVVGQSGGDSKEAIAALIEALKDTNGEVRHAAVQALGNLGESSKPAIPALLKALSDKMSGIRISAVYALGRIGTGAKAVPAVSQLLPDKDLQAANLALNYLENLKPEEIVEAAPALTAYIKDRDPEKNQSHVYRAISLLEKIGPAAKEAALTLNELLRDDDGELRNRAMKALKKISPEDKR